MDESMTITIRVPAFNDGCWGADTTDAQVPVIARNYTALANAYAAARFPHAERDIRTTHDAGYGSQGGTSAGEEFYDADDPQAPVWEITEYMARQWTEEPLWESDFDADAYLAEHPR
jgi:hypothetical protein